MCSCKMQWDEAFYSISVCDYEVSYLPYAPFPGIYQALIVKPLMSSFRQIHNKYQKNLI